MMSRSLLLCNSAVRQRAGFPAHCRMYTLSTPPSAFRNAATYGTCSVLPHVPCSAAATKSLYLPVLSLVFTRSFRLGRALHDSPGSLGEKLKPPVSQDALPPAKPDAAKPDLAPVKPSLMARIREECKHYYNGGRLLGLEARVSCRYVQRLLRGERLTRRELRQLRRTTIDMIRLVPFVMLIMIPFAELALPFLLKFFPNMLPSTFEKKFEQEEKRRRLLKLRMELAKFLQQTINEMCDSSTASKINGSNPPSSSSGSSPDAAKEFSNFFSKIRSSGVPASTADVLAIAKRFENELTLEKLTRPQIATMCRYMGITAFGTDAFLRFHLNSHMQKIVKDDRLIAAEGVNSLTPIELQKACSERGIKSVGVEPERLRFELQQWLDLNLVHKIPSSLLILSRAFLLDSSDSSSPTATATATATASTHPTLTSTVIPKPQSLGSHVLVERVNEFAENTSTPTGQDGAATRKESVSIPTAEALLATLESLPQNLIDEAELQLNKIADSETLEKRIEAIREEEMHIDEEREEEAAQKAWASVTVSKTNPDGVSAQSVKDIGEAIKVLTESSALGEEREELAMAQLEHKGGEPDPISARVGRLVRRVTADADEYERESGPKLNMLNLSNPNAISQSDIEQALTFARSRPDSEEVRRLVALLDSDGDGKIALDQLLTLAKQLEDQEGQGIVFQNPFADTITDGKESPIIASESPSGKINVVSKSTSNTGTSEQ